MDDTDRRTFLRVIETGALTSAARELRTDVSTVSRRIAGLETRLGVQLIERGSRRSTPTAAGLRYYEALRRLIDEQDALEADLRGETTVPRGLLRVACPTNLGERHVTGWALTFQRQFPEVTIELLLDDRYVDLRGANIDVAIRIGQLGDSALTAKRLGAMKLGLFASPDYLTSQGTPVAPADLENHHFVLFSLLQAGDKLVFTNSGGMTAGVAMRSKFSINNVGAIEQAVLAGAGLHAGPLWLFAPLQAAGRLVRVLPDWSPPLYPVHAVHNFGRRAPAKVTRLVDHFTAALRKLDGIER